MYWNILMMHLPINGKSPNNTSKWQMGFNSAFKGLNNTPPTTHSNQFQLYHDSSRQQYGTYIIHYSVELTAFSAEYTLFNICNFNLVYRYSLSVNLTLSITV